MKKNFFALILPIVFLSLSLNAQTDKTSKFSFQISYATGSSVIQNEGIYTRLSTAGFEILGTYQFKDNLGISAGVSLFGLNGNSFNENGNYNQTRGILRIPILLNANKYLNEKTQFITSGGLFINHIIEDSYKYVNYTEDLKFENWSMGLSGRLGICHDVFPKTAVGVAYNIQYNFSDFVKTQNDVDNRMSTNTLDILVKFKL